MLLCALVIAPVALVAERGAPLVFDARSLGALLYLAVFGSALTFTVYYWLLARVTAGSASLDLLPDPDRRGCARRGAVRRAAAAAARSAARPWCWPAWSWSRACAGEPERRRAQRRAGPAAAGATIDW